MENLCCNTLFKLNVEFTNVRNDRLLWSYLGKHWFPINLRLTHLQLEISDGLDGGREDLHLSWCPPVAGAPPDGVWRRRLKGTRYRRPWLTITSGHRQLLRSGTTRRLQQTDIQQWRIIKVTHPLQFPNTLYNISRQPHLSKYSTQKAFPTITMQSYLFWDWKNGREVLSS